MTAEQKLEAFFAAQTPAAQDFRFELSVMERVARRRALAHFSHMGMIAMVLSGVVLAAAGAVSAGHISSLLPLLAGLASSAVAGLVVWTVRPAGAAANRA